MSVILADRIILIMESSCLGQLIDHILFGNEKMPTLCSFRAVIVWHISGFFFCSQLWSFLRVKADRQYLKISSCTGLQISQVLGEVAQCQFTEHCAVVISKNKDDRFRAEILTQPNSLTGFIPQAHVQWKLGIHILVKRYCRGIDRTFPAAAVSADSPRRGEFEHNQQKHNQSIQQVLS